MTYFVYETRNKLNGKIYIGVHCGDESDEYLGSGKLLLLAIKKHGVEQFQRTILSAHSTLEAAFAEERRLVNEEFVARQDTYNLKLGGEGSWLHRRGIARTAEERAKISAGLKGRIFSLEHKKKISAAHHDVSGSNNPMYGKTTSGTFTRENHPFAKRVQIAGTIYSSVLQASLALKLPRYKIKQLNELRDDQTLDRQSETA